MPSPAASPSPSATPSAAPSAPPPASQPPAAVTPLRDEHPLPPWLAAQLGPLPWQPLYPGFAVKVLRGGDDDDTRVLLLRVEPGTVVRRHRHAGEVHAFLLAGHRRLLEAGLDLGPGAYVYEPPGNVDSWMGIGDAPAYLLVTARGAIEYLTDDGEVDARSTTSSVSASYRAFAASATAAAR